MNWGRTQATMPIIFITGYGDVAKNARAQWSSLRSRLAMKVLLSAVRQALDRRETTLDQAAEMRTLRDRYASLSSREREVMSVQVLCS